ncbi:MAG: hypothetical protein GKR90_25160 [Pseudomonadales bacterium]|nr:hypothetical protein [Pseudomonadales bacterium]
MAAIKVGSDRRVIVAQLEILYEHIPIALLGSVFMSSLGVWLLFDHVALPSLLVWYGTVLAMVAIRLCQFLINRANPVSAETAHVRGWSTGIFSGVFGCVWAWFAIAYVQPSDPLLISHVGLLIICVIAGAMVTQSAYLPSLVAFMLPAGVGSSYAMTLHTGEYSYLGILGVGLFAMAMVFSLRIHRMFARIIDTQFENDDLMLALEEKKTAAEEASRAKSKFLADASHDVRQPLNATGLYLAMLRDNPGDQEIIRRMEASIELLEAMYTRVLEVARLDEGAVETVSALIDVDDLVTEVADRHRAAAQEKGLGLRVETGRVGTIETDPVLIVRVLDNLVSNAVKYTARGEVHLSTNPSSAGVEIHVRDSGIGIPLELQDRIFDEYFQLESNGVRSGQGLGLAIVRRLCQLMDIELSLTSFEGRGSHFQLDVPRRLRAWIDQSEGISH